MKLFDFTSRYLRGDIFGGVTAGIVALPLALAFGVQSGMGAIAGLYGAIFIGVLAAFFGGTNTQVSGPTGPMTVVSAAVVLQAPSWSPDPELVGILILATFALAGIFQILFGVLKIGTYIKFIPYPVVSGFMTGIGVIIILLQIFPFLGLESPKKIIDIFAGIPQALGNINIQAVLLTALTIIIIYLFPRLTKAVPSPLVALVIGTVLALVANMDVRLIGDIPKGFPSFETGIFSGDILGYFHIIAIPALTLAALGAIDSLLTSVVADNITRTKHDSNRELIGQGIGNTISGFFGGLPGAGATMRTVVNINAGGRTRISGMVHGFLLLAILLGLGTLAALIPLPVLAGILITVGIGIIDYKGLRNIRMVPVADAAIMIIVLILTVFVDLLVAVGIGMVLAALLFMKKMSEITEENTNMGVLSDIEDDLPWDDEKIIDQEIASEVYIKHLYGPLFFGFSGRYQELSRTIPDVKVVIIRFGRVPYIDQSGFYALEEAISTLKGKGVKVFLCGLKGQPLKMLEKMKVIPEMVPQDKVFETFNSCILAVREIVKQKIENNDKQS